MSDCGINEYEDTDLGLRVGAIFVVLATSLVGTLFPIIAKRSTWNCPTAVFDFAKYFGSGVIIATAFVHLLAPAFEALGSECLTGVWSDYDWAAVIPMISILMLFFVEYLSHRWGKAKLEAAGFGRSYDPRGHDLECPVEDSASGARQLGGGKGLSPQGIDSETSSVDSSWTKGDSIAQILGVCILEFGIVFHSIFVGITLATATGHSQFVILFVVIIFHQTFEGLGLGCRLAFLPLPRSMNWIPIAGSILYSCSTPVGQAIGLAIRTSYSDSNNASLISEGIFDAISAGILLWTSCVELLAREFIFNNDMQTASTGKILYAFTCVCLGAGLMALLGYWA